MLRRVGVAESPMVAGMTATDPEQRSRLRQDIQCVLRHCDCTTSWAWFVGQFASLHTPIPVISQDRRERLPVSYENSCITACSYFVLVCSWMTKHKQFSIISANGAMLLEIPTPLRNRPIYTAPMGPSNSRRDSVYSAFGVVMAC